MDPSLALLLAVLGVVVAIVAAAGTWAGVLRRPPRRRVQYYIDRSMRFLPDIPAGDIVAACLGLQGKQDVAITVVRFANTGRVSLPPSEWDGPLEIRCSGQRVLSARQSNASPSGLEVGLRVDGDRVLVDPFLLNSRDLVEIELTTEKSPEVSVHARIKDVRRVARKRYVYPPGTGIDGALMTGDKIVYFVGFPAMLILFLVLGLTQGTAEAQLLSVIWVLALTIAIYGFLIWAITQSRTWRPR